MVLTTVQIALGIAPCDFSAVVQFSPSHSPKHVITSIHNTRKEISSTQLILIMFPEYHGYPCYYSYYYYYTTTTTNNNNTNKNNYNNINNNKQYNKTIIIIIEM